jgi:hypothetical protein
MAIWHHPIYLQAQLQTKTCAEQTKGSPTFVNLDKPYPNQVFMILIWGEDLPKFTPKPSTWDGKRVCATGQITSYQGLPETIAKAPGQIKVGDSK